MQSAPEAQSWQTPALQTWLLQSCPRAQLAPFTFSGMQFPPLQNRPATQSESTLQVILQLPASAQTRLFAHGVVVAEGQLGWAPSQAARLTAALAHWPLQLAFLQLGPRQLVPIALTLQAPLPSQASSQESAQNVCGSLPARTAEQTPGDPCRLQDKQPPH